jgi:hypothetical protein
MEQQLTRPNTPWQVMEFTATGQVSYPMEILNDQRSPRKHEMPDENFEGTEEVHSNVDSPLRADGPDLPTSASA